MERDLCRDGCVGVNLERKDEYSERQLQRQRQKRIRIIQDGGTRRDRRKARGQRKKHAQGRIEATPRRKRGGLKLCRVLGDYIRSWEQELERPRYVMDKMWQNVQSNGAKTMNLDKDIEEILNTAKQTGWNGSTKTTRVWTEKEEDDP